MLLLLLMLIWDANKQHSVNVIKPALYGLENRIQRRNSLPHGGNLRRVLHDERKRSIVQQFIQLCPQNQNSSKHQNYKQNSKFQKKKEEFFKNFFFTAGEAIERLREVVLASEGLLSFGIEVSDDGGERRRKRLCQRLRRL